MIKYLENSAVAALLEVAPVYQKKGVTLLRAPRQEEIGSVMTTYVKSDSGVAKESSCEITADKVIARNPGVIGQLNGQDVYNEWPIDIKTAVKNYSQAIVDGLSQVEFQPHKKSATLKAIELTSDVMSLLGVQGDTLAIKVDWSEEPMIAKLGAYLTSGGYCVSQADMQAYEVVQ